MQGSAADVCKAAMVTLHAKASAMFPGRPAACRLILQVHAQKVLPGMCANSIKHCPQQPWGKELQNPATCYRTGIIGK